MLKEMTRARVIMLWFATVAVVVGASAALGASVSPGTAAVLFGLLLVPPAIVLFVWPAVQPRTVAEVLHDVDG
jgi:hypothetical protein